MHQRRCFSLLRYDLCELFAPASGRVYVLAGWRFCVFLYFGHKQQTVYQPPCSGIVFTGLGAQCDTAVAPDTGACNLGTVRVFTHNCPHSPQARGRVTVRHAVGQQDATPALHTPLTAILCNRVHAKKARLPQKIQNRSFDHNQRHTCHAIQCTWVHKCVRFLPYPAASASRVFQGMHVKLAVITLPAYILAHDVSVLITENTSPPARVHPCAEPVIKHAPRHKSAAPYLMGAATHLYLCLQHRTDFSLINKT